MASAIALGAAPLDELRLRCIANRGWLLSHREAGAHSTGEHATRALSSPFCNANQGAGVVSPADGALADPSKGRRALAGTE